MKGCKGENFARSPKNNNWFLPNHCQLFNQAWPFVDEGKSTF